MKHPNISLPIDEQLDLMIRKEANQTKLSRADVIRQALREHFGLNTHKANGTRKSA